MKRWLLAAVLALVATSCKSQDAKLGWGDLPGRLSVVPTREDFHVTFSTVGNIDNYVVVLVPGKSDDIEQVVSEVTVEASDGGSCFDNTNLGLRFCDVSISPPPNATATEYTVFVAADGARNVAFPPLTARLVPSDLSFDPVIGQAAFLQEIPAPNGHVDGHFGGTISAGDVNGDGRMDLVISDYGLIVDDDYACGDVTGAEVGGGAHLFLAEPPLDFGSLPGINAAPASSVTSNTGYFASGIAIADLDVDGLGDILVHDNTVGTVRVTYGKDAGAPQLDIPNFSATPPAGAAIFGARMLALGQDDRVLIADPDRDVMTSPQAGVVHVMELLGVDALAEVVRVEGAPQDSVRRGSSLAVGDFDNDVDQDFVMGGPSVVGGGGPGGIWVASAENGTFVDAGNVVTDDSPEYPNGTLFGFSVSSGHFSQADGADGDQDDIVVGEPDYSSTSTVGGRIHVFDFRQVIEGSSTTPESEFVIDATTLYGGAPGDAAGAHFGTDVAVIDLNGDYVDDLAVGAPGDPDTGGTVWIFPILGGNPLSPQNTMTIPGTGTEQIGFVLVNAGDINGDETDDLVMGMPCDNTDATDAGKVLIQYGVPSAGPEVAPILPPLRFPTNDVALGAFPLRARFPAAPYECTIDWGDSGEGANPISEDCGITAGSPNSTYLDSATHSYAAPGVYTVRVTIELAAWDPGPISYVQFSVCVGPENYVYCD